VCCEPIKDKTASGGGPLRSRFPLLFGEIEIFLWQVFVIFISDMIV